MSTASPSGGAQDAGHREQKDCGAEKMCPHLGRDKTRYRKGVAPTRRGGAGWQGRGASRSPTRRRDETQHPATAKQMLRLP